MKKFSLFLSFLLAFALTAKAQDFQELLVEDAAKELTDGTVIALQNRTNGTDKGKFFNGEKQQLTFTTYILYIVEGNAKEGMKLRRLADGKYVGGENQNSTYVVMTDDAQNAMTFTAASVGHGGACDANPSLMNGTKRDLLVRFNVKDGIVDNLALNTAGSYYYGTGAQSVWYVYAYRSCHENTVTNAEAELLDGTVIALQSRDYNGGAGYYFNGKEAKTATFSANNLFVVEGNAAGGMKLRRFPNGQYIGKSGDTVTEVNDAKDAATFTAKSYRGGNGFSQFSHDTELDGTMEDLYVRLSVTEETNTTYLNTQNYDHVPQYVDDMDGCSVWYVYKFPESSATLSEVSLSFDRTGETVNVNMNTSGVNVSEGAGATFETATSTKLNIANKILPTVVCPNANIGSGGSGNLTFRLTGLPNDFTFSQALLEIHSLDQNGNYHSQPRYCTVTLSCGEGENRKQLLLDDFNIHDDKVSGNTYYHENWGALTGDPITAENNELVLTLNITRGDSNPKASAGFYFGLSGIRLIGERISEVGSGNSEETVTKMNAADVQDLLASIKSGYKRIGYDFPVQVEGADVKWPQALENVFSDLSSNFELITHAENGENLDAAKKNLADFIRISNKKYPVSVAYTAAADYGTLYMPFAVASEQLPAGLAFLQCEEVDEDGVLIFRNNDQDLAANTSFIVKVIDNGSESESPIGKTTQFIGFYDLNTQANSNSPLKGTHENIPAPLGSYVLQKQTHGLGFYLVGEESETQISAGKCYLDLTGVNAQGLQFLRFPDDTLTAIDAIDDAEPANAATYDLSGRRVTTTTTRGLYIMGGRKVLVK